MPRYIVKGIDIRKGGKHHPEGSEIELDEAEAKELAAFLEEAPPEEPKAAKAGKDKK